jgi:hypothetical protein
LAPLSAAHAAKAYPGIFRNEKAAKYALAEAGIPAAETELGPNSPIGVSIRRNGPSSCRYQLAGRGRRIAAALVDPAAVPDPRSWLQERLGPLSGFWPISEPLTAKSVDLIPDLASPVWDYLASPKSDCLLLENLESVLKFTP